MNIHEKDKCGCICYSVVGLSLFIFTIILTNSSDFVEWSEARQGMAGWFQFMGSIFAIFGAVWISGESYRKKIHDDKKDIRRVASIHAISIISNLLSAKNKFEDFYSIYPGVPNVAQKEVVRQLNEIVNKIILPSGDFVMCMVKVNSDCAKAMAISNEALKQLKPHLERCKDSNFKFSKGKPDPILELANLISENIKVSYELTSKFLREEGMVVYSGEN